MNIINHNQKKPQVYIVREKPTFKIYGAAK